MHLLREIEKFIRCHNIPPSRFGREAVGDPCLVRDLRNGRDPRPITIERAQKYMNHYPKGE